MSKEEDVSPPPSSSTAPPEFFWPMVRSAMLLRYETSLSDVAPPVPPLPGVKARERSLRKSFKPDVAVFVLFIASPPPSEDEDDDEKSGVRDWPPEMAFDSLSEEKAAVAEELSELLPSSHARRSLISLKIDFTVDRLGGCSMTWSVPAS